MSKIKLAEALLRRKELQGKVEILKRLKDTDAIYHVHSVRIKVNEGIDNLEAQFPKLTASQVTEEFDQAARKLRLIDAAIQQTNWTAEVDLPDPTIMQDYVKPAEKPVQLKTKLSEEQGQ